MYECKCWLWRWGSLSPHLSEGTCATKMMRWLGKQGHGSRFQELGKQWLLSGIAPEARGTVGQQLASCVQV